MRCDLAPPVLKRVSDRKNYGDESYAYGLMNPSVYSNKGVYEKDFMMPRSREEVGYNYSMHNQEQLIICCEPVPSAIS